MALVELQTELREWCNVEVSVTTITCSQQRQGYTMKMVCCLGLLASLRLTIYKVTCPALERNKQDYQEYMVLVAAHFHPDQLVFADKSHFNRLTLRRPYTWSIRGECDQHYEFTFQGTKYSMLPVLSLDGILHLKVLKNAITSEDFWQFVEGLLLCMNEWLLPNLVLVIDNVAIHKVQGICKMVEEHVSQLLYLPTYSPDYNPIENTFSSIKSWLHSNHDCINLELDSVDGTVYDIFWEAIRSITADDSKGWYKHCGYHEVLGKV